MKRLIGMVVGALGGLLASTSAFAQGDSTSSVGLIAIGSGLAIGLGALGAATGQGRAAGSALEGIARNPTSRDQVFMPMILGLVFMEFQALLGFLIAFMWFNSI